MATRRAANRLLRGLKAQRKAPYQMKQVRAKASKCSVLKKSSRWIVLGPRGKPKSMSGFRLRLQQKEGKQQRPADCQRPT